MAGLDCLWRRLKGENLLFAQVIGQCVHSIKEGEVAPYLSQHEQNSHWSCVTEAVLVWKQKRKPNVLSGELLFF